MSNEAFKSACQAHSLGQLDHADRLFRAVPSNAPEFPDAVMALAVIAYQRGRFPDAVVHFSKFAALRPGDAANHCNLGECLRECGRLDEALSQIKLGISLDPDQPDAFNSLGLIYHSQRKLELAEEAIRQALKLRPQFPMALINLGMVLQEKRKLKESALLFRQALELDPDNPMGNSNLGQILVEIGRVDDLDEAEQCCLKAVRMTPDRPHPINNLGNVYRAMGRYEEALECYHKAMAIAPDLAMPLNNMGQALQGRARYEEASDYYLNAISRDPNSARFHANFASMLNDQDLHEEALLRYQHALAIDPLHAESHFGVGQVYMQLQDSESAEAAFRKSLEIDSELTAPRIGLANLYSEMGNFEKSEAESAIALKSHPKLVEVYYQRATHQKGKVTDTDLEQMQNLLNEKYFGEGAKAQLNFALGSVFDKRKNFAMAGQHFQSANELQNAAKLKRNEFYDPNNFSEWINKNIESFTPELMKAFQGQGHESRRPIFVMGLPRSGTTLTEQILASHSSVHGAGELIFVSKSFEKLPETLGLTGTESFSAVKSLHSLGLKASAELFLKEISNKNSELPHVVDKMPDNVNLLGWINLMFPNARVIHCRRDLRDIALSCFQTCFGSIRWANNWQDLARRFTDYLRVVKHWESIEGIEWLDFPYEKVTEDTEGYARKLIDYVGMDWEPDCLNFHETKRQVRTASLSQVREPIYKTSVAKWKNYEREMAPFIEEMERQGHHFD